MKKWITRLAQGFLAFSAVSLLGALALPWRGLSPPPPPPAPSGGPPIDFRGQRTAAERVSPDEVLSLFGMGRDPAPTRAVPSRQPDAPVDAPWLLYLGFYNSVSGGPSYLLKDTRSGRLITAGSRDSPRGWSIVSVEKERLIVRNDSVAFIVRKR
ncbi:MAG: hypothetical protein ACLQDL_02050 [Spirochaetia bacterium]